MILYFGYGSNLHPLRISHRVGKLEPAVPDRLDGYSLTFDMCGADGSAKCNIKSASKANRVFGVCYKLNTKQWDVLLEYERGYGTHNVKLASGQFARTFIAEADRSNASFPPYSWYRDIVVAGMERFDFDYEYVELARQVDAIEDPDAERAAEMGAHLSEMRRANAS